MPERIQRQRAKGWRMPPGAVYVGRPSKWGNPFRVGDPCLFGFVLDRADAVRHFQRIEAGNVRDLQELRGKDLVCWCPLVDADGNPVPCHADVLLEWANS